MVEQPSRSELAAENERLQERVEDLENNESQQPATTRRWLVRGAGTAVGVSLLSLLFGSASAAPSGTFPQSTDSALLKLRADRTRYIARQSAPSTPPSGTITVYARDGDL